MIIRTLIEFAFVLLAIWMFANREKLVEIENEILFGGTKDEEDNQHNLGD